METVFWTRAPCLTDESVASPFQYIVTDPDETLERRRVENPSHGRWRAERTGVGAGRDVAWRWFGVGSDYRQLKLALPPRSA